MDVTVVDGTVVDVLVVGGTVVDVLGVDGCGVVDDANVVEVDAAVVVAG